MPFKIIFLLTVVFSIPGCLIGDTKCCENVGSNSISKGLYLERYRTFCAGVFGELTECYLTDSTTFRQKIGSYDEHERFFARLNGNKIEAYNYSTYLISDTIEKKTITKADLWKNHQIEKDCFALPPIFGTNTIKCNDNFYPASSYKTDDGNFLTEVQYKCDNDYSNAVFYTDSLHFCVFVGIYIPGSRQNNYKVKMNANNVFDFYNIEDKVQIDTVKVATYLLTELTKGKFIKVCK